MTTLFSLLLYILVTYTVSSYKENYLTKRIIKHINSETELTKLISRNEQKITFYTF